MIRPDLEQLPPYIPGARNDTALKLSSNEVSQPPLPAAAQAMAEAAAGANRYPDMFAVDIRERLAEHLGVTFEQVTVGTGSSALCQQLVQVTCLANQPSEVIFPWRSFEAYPIFARVVGATPVPVPLTAEHGVDLEGLLAAITPDTKLIFVCNPNNPTGSTTTAEEFDAFMAQVPADVVVGLDEAYIEYFHGDSTPLATEAISRYDNLIGLRTFSKAYGLAGVRIGYAFGNPDIISAMQKVSIPFGVSSVAQVGAIASLEAQDELQLRVKETVVERDRVEQALAEFGVPHSEANHVWLPAANIAAAGFGTPQELAAKLAEHDVLVRAFDEGIRITVTVAEETDKLLEAWDKAVGGATA